MNTAIRPFFIVKTAFKTLLLLYLCICLGMWAGQRSIMYHPSLSILPLQNYGLQDYTDVNLTTADNIHITGWYHKARTGYPAVIFFHGIGMNMGYDAHFFHALTDTGFGLLAIDYRGYGASEGTPSEQGIYKDSRAAMQYALKTLALPSDKILLYGESMGTAVVVQMATEYPVAAIILQSPFTSIEVIGRLRYPWLPVHLILEDRFDSLSKISHIHAPLLLMHGERDTIVPIEDGKTLFARANLPKEAIYFPLKGHTDLDINSRTKALLEFCNKHNLIQSKAPVDK